MSPKSTGQRVAKRWKDADKKTLESEEERFMGVVADAIVQTKISCLSGVRDAARRRTLANAFEEIGATEDLRVSLGRQRRLRVLPGKAFRAFEPCRSSSLDALTRTST